MHLNQSDSKHWKQKNGQIKLRESSKHDINVKQTEFKAKGIKQANQKLYINENFKSTERSGILYQNVQGEMFMQ